MHKQERTDRADDVQKMYRDLNLRIKQIPYLGLGSEIKSTSYIGDWETKMIICLKTALSY